MAEKLGLTDGETCTFEFGNTFNKGYKDEAYYTIRYDFKPASVDTQKKGTLDVEDKEVTVTIPHVEGAGASETSVFKGGRMPASKECLLVIDHNTGDIVLERISQNIRVKKTRNESSNRKPFAPRPSTPMDTLRKSSPSHSQSVSNTAKAMANTRQPPCHKPVASKSHSKSKGKTSKGARATADSMPMLSFEEENKNCEVMSDSSSDSDSNSGSSSSSDSESDSETETHSRPISSSNNPGMVNGTTGPSPGSILSDLELSTGSDDD